MTISEPLKKLYASSGSDTILHTLEFSHPTWNEPFFIVRDWDNFTANLENSGALTVFNRFAFDIKGPDKDENGGQTLQITVDAVSLELTNLLDLANQDTHNNPIEVTYRIYIDSDTTTPQVLPPLKLVMRAVNVNDQKITGKADLMGLQNKRFPNVLYGTDFQSLYNA